MNRDQFYIYVLPPIDFGWNMLFVADHGEEPLRALLNRAAALPDGLAWEGDFSWGPGQFAIPTDTEFTAGYAWKQANNGTTYIASPIKLPWLDALDLQK
jgi:hypothetical protein